LSPPLGYDLWRNQCGSRRSGMTTIPMSSEQIKSVDDILGKILVLALEKRDFVTARYAEVASRLLGARRSPERSE
jgi:hypothetical protein